MFLNVVSLLVGFLCLFVVFLMLISTKANRKANLYLILILFIAGLQRFVNAIEVLEFTKITYSPLKIRFSFAFFIIPIYYLFFKRLIQKNSKLNMEYQHFILPTVLVLMSINNYYISYYFYLAFSFFYFVSILLLVKELTQMKKLSMLVINNYNTIRTWAFLMTFIVFLLVVYSNYFLFSETRPRINLNVFFRFSSLLWLVAIIYMFRNPIIIFGEQHLIKSLQKNTHQDIVIWNFKPLKEIEEKDQLIFNSISKRIDSIILDIQSLQKSVPIISTTTLTAKTIAQELKIPKSHLDIIFKYYCYYSVNDFSNLVKVNYALSLINEGYLKNYTVASLGEKCLFNSRFTFSKNFKKFVGVSISIYTNETFN